MKDKILMSTSVLVLTISSAKAALEVNVYGILKTSIISASQEVTSFGKNTHTAITHVAEVDTSSAANQKYSKKRRTSFQTQQTRIGVLLKANTKLSGRFEVDFADFNQSTHATGNQTRIRIASIDYKITDQLQLTTGQKWLTFMGVAPYMNNLVQAGYYSGRTAFIGQEATLKYTTEKFNFYATVLAKGKNLTDTQTQTELGSLPGATLRVDYKSSYGVIGAAIIASKMETDALKTNTSNTFEDSNSYAYKIFTKLNIGGFDIRGEFFQGQNTEDLALLALGGSAYDEVTGTNVKTWGGFTSIAYKFNPTHTLYSGLGYAVNDDALGRNLSLADNKMARLGYEYHFNDGVKVFFESTQYETKRVVNNAYKSYDANVAELGLLWFFK